MSEVLKGKLCQFNMGGVNRRWFTVDLTFEEVKRILVIEPYSADTGKGEQRERIEAWSKNLKKQMVNGNFTPAPWAAGIREVHLPYLKVEKNRVELEVPDDMPIPCLDGNQRWGGLELAYKEADPAGRKIIDKQNVTVQIYLNPEEIKADFKRLQMGRPVDKSHLLSLSLSDSNANPVMVFALKVTRLLNRDSNSHLLNQVKFDSSDKAKLAFASLATPGGSDLSTSVYTGARIASHENFQKDERWLQSMYVAAYQAIIKYGSTVTVDLGAGDEDITELFLKGRMLYPTILGGGKGGSSLLIGLGNCLAFRMAHLGKDEVTPKDLKRLVEVAENVFNYDTDGNMSGGTKRKFMGAFAREYFSDLIVHPGEEADRHKLASMDGIPVILVTLTAKSTWAISKDWKKQQLLINDEEGSDDEEDETVEDAEANFFDDTDPLSGDNEDEEGVEVEVVEEEEEEEIVEVVTPKKRGRKSK